eukprot:883646-Rhodomonas_salina.2
MCIRDSSRTLRCSEAARWPARPCGCPPPQHGPLSWPGVPRSAGGPRASSPFRQRPCGLGRTWSRWTRRRPGSPGRRGAAVGPWRAEGWKSQTLSPVPRPPQLSPRTSPVAAGRREVVVGAAPPPLPSWAGVGASAAAAPSAARASVAAGPVPSPLPLLAGVGAEAAGTPTVARGSAGASGRRRVALWGHGRC